MSSLGEGEGARAQSARDGERTERPSCDAGFGLQVAPPERPGVAARRRSGSAVRVGRLRRQAKSVE
jgi:hypothetical protein